MVIFGAAEFFAVRRARIWRDLRNLRQRMRRFEKTFCVKHSLFLQGVECGCVQAWACREWEVRWERIECAEILWRRTQILRMGELKEIIVACNGGRLVCGGECQMESMA
jgi:hypothetical protein